MAINKISTETKNAILRKSAYTLPNRPSDQGMKPEDIKRAFWQPVTDATESALTEIDRVVEEANTEIVAVSTPLSSHISNTNNPHSVTKGQVGLGSVDNIADVNKPVSTPQQAALTAHNNSETAHGDIRSSISNHTSNTSNPHGVTKAQVGLGNCDNTSDINKPVSNLQQAALDLKIDKSSIADNLTTNDATKVASAKQAKVLKDTIDIISPKVEASVKTITLNSTTGVMTITFTNGTSTTIDLPLEYLVKSGSYDPITKRIILTLENNTTIPIPVGDLVNEYFADGTTLELYTDSVDSNKLKFRIKTSLMTNINENTSKRHQHENKTLLDSYTQTETNLASAVSNKHSHSNKDLLDTYTQTETNLADSVTKKHEHTNKNILENITSAFTSEQALKIATNETNIATLQSNYSEILNKFGAVEDLLDLINGEVV